jgi:hypothetical protein
MSLTEIREHLIAALNADFVGPFVPPTDDGEDADEVLPLSPSRWYLTGFLAPAKGRELEASEGSEDEAMAAGSDQDDEDAGTADPEPKRKNILPASLGLSVLLPPSSPDETARVTLRYAEYKAEDDPEKRRTWVRQSREPVVVDMALEPDAIARGVRLDVPKDVWLAGRLGEVTSPGLEAGTRALSLFVVNRRVPSPGRQAEQFLFQVSLDLEYERGFVPRRNVLDDAKDWGWDEKIADLQYRHAFEYAVGHGVGVEVLEARHVRTTWIPRAKVRSVTTRKLEAVTTSMEELAEIKQSSVSVKLEPLVEEYGAWLLKQRKIDLKSDASQCRDTGRDTGRDKTRDQILDEARRACDRIQEGIDLLEKDEVVHQAFSMANWAMAKQARKGNPGRYTDGKKPHWRLFQLAFLLMNLPSIADGRHKDRDQVELIFFPTGGGKTEAYLGVIAFCLVLRRLRGRERADGGYGVAVILRYTLRLLTLDQLRRAATLICALEVLRRHRPQLLGDVRFSVGLWVGKSATANTLKEIGEQIVEYQSSTSVNAMSPFPLTHCPWCQEPLSKSSLSLLPTTTKPEEVVVGCDNFDCDFVPGLHPEGLPVIFVDEQVYREVPSFLVATVDKFAMLPWRGETGMLFGRATSRDGQRFYGPLDKKTLHKDTKRDQLPEGLRPPELIVQDELHLISGPLGTMVGLYETAVDTLCRQGDSPGPKILASTATVRRARQQVQALFGRQELAIFPPPAVDASETFFAQVDQQNPGRLYIGLAASGRSMKALLLRTYVALLGATEHAAVVHGKANDTADAYMTLAGYFNSLRELGGMRRLVEDEATQRCWDIEKRRPLNMRGSNPWFRRRRIAAEPVELTSRRSSAEIKDAKARLNLSNEAKDSVDVLLASNMISVGVDIDRLGLMVVAGQPKTTAEYIQASSRVGRQSDRPGLVVTCFNVHRPRDRSQYEHFTAYHESFYRHVEATSLTPFSGPAIERGLAGTLVAMARLTDPALTPPGAVMDLPDHAEIGARAARLLAQRAGLQPGADYDAEVKSLEAISIDFFDAWKKVVLAARADGYKHAYSPFDRDKKAGKALLYTALDEDPPDEGEPEAKFMAPTSMRDVESTVHLWLKRGKLGS